MKIKLKTTFSDRQERQVSYIARDSPSRARKFKKDLIKQIRDLPANP